MDKIYSEGFMQDMADLILACAENETDNVELSIDFNGKTLKINITFSIDE